MQIKTDVKIRISSVSSDGKGHFFMGPGIYDLLKEIQRSGSVSLACSNLDLSYSKGWKMIKNAEKGFGRSLVIRQQGGAGGGCAKITDIAITLLEAFERTNVEITKLANEVVEKNYNNIVSGL